MGNSKQLFSLSPFFSLLLCKIKVEFEEMDIDFQSIPYLDPQREAQRQENILREAKMKEQGLESKSQRQKRKREEREHMKAKVIGKSQNKTCKTKPKSMAERFEEWNELAFETRLIKKLKQGKITKEEYERILLDGDSETEAQIAFKPHKRIKVQSKSRGKQEQSSKRGKGSKLFICV